MNQQIRFCKSFDGTRIAYAVTGDGPLLVKAPHWLTHLEYEFRSPLWKPWIEALSHQHSLLRMDERGCGLSDWEVSDFSFDAYVRDLEAVVDAAGFERFALFGHSQGGAIAVEYAVRNPERVSHLVLLGTYARGWLRRGLPPQRIEELHAQLKLIEIGWGRDDPSYRQIFSSQFIPGGSLEMLQSFSEMQRLSTSPENAARIVRSFFEIDITAVAPRVRLPHAGSACARRVACSFRGRPDAGERDPGCALRVPGIVESRAAAQRPGLQTILRGAQRLRTGRTGGAPSRRVFPAHRPRDPNSRAHCPRTRQRPNSRPSRALRENRAQTTSPTSSTRSASRTAPRPSCSRANAAWDTSPGFPRPFSPCPGTGASRAFARGRPPCAHKEVVMSTYQMVVRSSRSLFDRIEFGALGKAFWNWWIGLYAEPPRRLPPML